MKWRIWKDSSFEASWQWHLKAPEGLVMRYGSFEQARYELASALRGDGLPSLMY